MLGRHLLNQDQALLSAPTEPRIRTMTREMAACARAVGVFRLVAGLGLLVCLLWAFWPMLARMAQRWVSDPQYSHGYLVPGFALWLLWFRRQHLVGVTPRFSWWGIPILLFGLGMYLAGVFYYYDSIAQAALLPALVGFCVVLGGWTALRWAWPAIGFLVFMLPLPFRLEIMLSHPLRRICTLASTYLLQTCGFPAVSEGNVILLNDWPLGVAEACSGLSMLVVFFAISTAMVLVIQRPLLDKIVVVVSAAPIAVIANVIRITATGILGAWFGREAADKFFHNAAGLVLMMPVALGLLWFELWFLRRLFVEVPPETKQPAAPLKPALFAGMSSNGDKKKEMKKSRKS
jgi:exosortase